MAQLRGVLVLAAAAGEIEARPAGRMKRQAGSTLDLPAVGDWVVYEPPASGSIALVRAVLPRQSAFIRKSAGQDAEPQIVAANVDRVLLVHPLGQEVNRRRIERFVAFANESGAEAWVIFSKNDLASDDETAQAEALGADLTIPWLRISTRSGEGLAELERSFEPRRTYALVGPSGAGKSTLANKLLGGGQRMRTAEVLEDGRGQHTTTHRELLRLPSGALLLDTPGLRELQAWELDSGLAEAFADLELLAGACKFGDCRHRTEPGCAILAALAAGDLSQERLDSWSKLAGEATVAEERRDERARLRGQAPGEDRRQGPARATARQARVGLRQVPPPGAARLRRSPGRFRSGPGRSAAVVGRRRR